MNEKEIFLTIWIMIFQLEFVSLITSNHAVRMAVWIISGLLYGYYKGWLVFQQH